MIKPCIVYTVIINDELPISAISAAISVVVDCLVVALGFLTASRTLHKGALYPLFRAPMSFFDTTPVGRILNYFSTDLDTADAALPLDVQLWFISMTSLLSTVITIAFAKPLFLSIILPILAVNMIMQVKWQVHEFGDRYFLVHNNG